ncbi:MAG: ABC transporter permease [Anaerolineaceae bacterium]|nr:ABC transporter permease [Anaerolineaceae bacterium]MCY3906510.1 ABC transporter permease [Anaerolineaceae bacterium]
MLAWLIRRLIWLPFVLWTVTTLTFFALRLVPGNPIQSISNQMVDPVAIARIEAEWDLDKPLHLQYLYFMRAMLSGDTGISMSSGAPINRLMFERVPPTIELALVAMVFSTVAGIVIGVMAAVTRRRLIDNALRLLAITGMSMPWFWVAIMLVIVFAVRLRLAPTSGRIDPRLSYEVITNFMLIDHLLTGNREALLSFLHHLILPSLAIGITSTGFVTRLTRAAMLEELHSPYVRTARGKGLLERRVALRHALRNAILPVITLQGLQFGALLGGAVITEAVFAWPGLGRLLLEGILSRDYSVVQAAVIVVALAYVLMNTLVDLLYFVVDPRLNQS